MSELRGLHRSLSNGRLHLGLSLVSSLCFLVLLLAARPALAEEPDETYLNIYGQIQDAESQEASGHLAQALTNYQHAAVALQAFERKFPDWNTKVVSARRTRLTTKITSLSEQALAASRSSNNATSASASASASTSAGSTVKLLEAGAEPRKVLRLHPKAGDKQSLEATLLMNVDSPMGAMKLPPIKMTLDMNVQSVSTEGDIAYQMAVSEPTVTDDSGSAGPMAAMLKASLGGAKGMSGTGTVSDRGIARAMNVKAIGAAGAQGAQAMDQMKGMLSGAVLSLPEEAVGVGAKWEVQKSARMQGFPMNETQTFELVAVDGDRLTVKVSATQNAANQKIQGAAGMKMELTKLAGTTTGELTYDLGQIMPPEGTSKEHMDLTLSLGGAQKQTINQKMDMEIRLQSK